MKGEKGLVRSKQYTQVAQLAGQGCLSRPSALAQGSLGDVCFPEERKIENGWGWGGWLGPSGRAQLGSGASVC